MLATLGTLILLLAILGAIYFHLFVWQPKHPGEPWPWRLWAAFGGGAVIGLGLVLHNWPIVLLGIAIRIFSWLMRDDEKIAG
jgi:hypothetical protein